jgi:NADH-quinone oxidoreductase subunit L
VAAAIIHFFDEFLINGLLVGGLTRSAEGVGNLFRRVQSGNLQGYAFAFGFGVILIIYLTVFI